MSLMIREGQYSSNILRRNVNDYSILTSMDMDIDVAGNISLHNWTRNSRVWLRTNSRRNGKRGVGLKRRWLHLEIRLYHGNEAQSELST